MLFDYFPFGDTRTVPVADRAALLESPYEFTDESGRRMLYLQLWYD
jgi:hypothetical protein